MNLTPGKLWGMRRMADSNGLFKMIAVDQRPPISTPIAQQMRVKKAPWQQVARFKELLVITLGRYSSAMLLDPHYAIPACIDSLSPTKGLIVTLEDSAFLETENGRLSADIDNWSVNKIKRMAADAVKVLVWYRPDADRQICQKQQDYVQRIGEQCANCDIPFLLELLLYPLPSEESSHDYVEMSNKKTDLVLASVDTFAATQYGVDIFKLESPVSAQQADGSANVQALFDEMGRIANRPWVMLSAGTGKEQFYAILQHAYQAGASGYLAGRAIWLDAFTHYPDWQQIESGLREEASRYAEKIIALTDEHANPWHSHQCYHGQVGVFPKSPDFRTQYGAMSFTDNTK